MNGSFIGEKTATIFGGLNEGGTINYNDEEDYCTTHA